MVSKMADNCHKWPPFDEILFCRALCRFATVQVFLFKYSVACIQRPLKGSNKSGLFENIVRKGENAGFSFFPQCFLTHLRESSLFKLHPTW